MVPSEAVIRTGERNVVIVAREDGGFDVDRRRRWARRQTARTAISQGFRGGQRSSLSGSIPDRLRGEPAVRSHRRQHSSTRPREAQRASRRRAPEHGHDRARSFAGRSAIGCSCCSPRLLLAAWGVGPCCARRSTRLPDLSDVQVIIRTHVSRPGAAHRRGPGHVSAHDDDALGARREDRARLLVLRRLVRLRPVRRRHRSRTGRARACSST